MNIDYTAWSKEQDFRIAVVQEREYLRDKDFTANVIIPEDVLAAEAEWSEERAQREAELHRSLYPAVRRAA